MAWWKEGTGKGEGEEQRLRVALRHLQAEAEAGVLERLVYKHRNQHRGTAYFQYLLKVRRDLKLLLGASQGEGLNAVFPVLACRKPANTILVPNRQSKRKPGANHSHHERLLGAARLLSQMSEPVMMGAVCYLMLCQYTIWLLILLIGSSLLKSVLMECRSSDEIAIPHPLMWKPLEDEVQEVSPSQVPPQC